MWNTTTPHRSRADTGSYHLVNRRLNHFLVHFTVITISMYIEHSTQRVAMPKRMYANFN